MSNLDTKSSITRRVTFACTFVLFDYALASAVGSVDSALGASAVEDSVVAGASAEGSASEEVQRV